MKSKETSPAPKALDLTEHAVHLLRQQGRAALADYYIGALPFALALLYFWSDMSRNAYAQFHCAPAAAGLALLFIWMKVWQVRFCRRLWSALHDDMPEPWRWPRFMATAARQALLQATGFVTLPIAAVIVLPMGWVYAFYQNLSVMDGPATRNMKDLYRDAVEQAALWPGQNHWLLSIVSVFAMFVLANLAVGLMMTPYLIKWLLGIETRFTISGLHAMTNTTFLAIICALAYLCIDPIVKAAYTLRCFHGLSRHTGDDLRAALKPFLKAAVCLLMVCLAYAPDATARSQSGPGARAAEESVQDQGFADQLDQKISQVLQERRFAWRLPREQTRENMDDETGWLARTLKWLGKKIESVFEAIDRWLESLSEWLRKHLGDKEGEAASSRDWRGITRMAFFAVGGLLIVVLLVSLRRWWLNRKPLKKGKVRQPDEVAIDINDEGISASDLPRDRWLRMARELMDKGDYRQALRALYLAVLAQLGDCERLIIARYKSNRDYQMELRRRAHAEPELLEKFSRCMTAFEQAWYGMHPVVEQQLSQFMADQERIAHLVQHPA